MMILLHARSSASANFSTSAMLPIFSTQRDNENRMMEFAAEKEEKKEEIKD